MSKSKAITKRRESVFLNVEKISKTVVSDDIQILMEALDKEVGNRKLNKEEIEQLQSIMSVDALEAVKWKSVADVLKYVSIFAIAENNPEAVKRITEILLNILCIFYPAVGTARGLLAIVPDRLMPVLIKIGGFTTPEYLIYRGINTIAEKKSEKAKAMAEYDANAYEDMMPLIIVCKNKLLSSELNKLINKEDDIDDETVVGTKDGTVHTIIWNESAWETFHDRITSDDRVLIIGKIKNAPSLFAEQIRFEQFGVKYGWDKNIAIIEADPKCLNSKSYNDFLAAINALQISDKLKKNAKFKFDWAAAGKLAIFPPLVLGDILREGTAVREQQLLFGLYNMYMQGLAEFLNPGER